MKILRFEISGEDVGTRLDHFLARELGKALAREKPSAGGGSELSRSKIRKLIMAGAVRVDGRPARTAGAELRSGARIEVRVEWERLNSDEASENDREWNVSAEAIAFEDEWLIAINKPAGLPTQPTLDPSRPNLFGLLQKFLTERDGPAAGAATAYVGLHHRLDRDTSGIVLFTKKKEANFGVSELFKNHAIRKSYLAIAVPAGAASKALEDRFTIRNFLKKDSLKKGRMRAVKAGGDVAITHFEVLTRGKGAVVIQAEPQTGRMHQIRVHLSERGWPIFADPTYGRKLDGLRLALHAARLTFKHPLTSLDVEVRAPIPPDFQKCLTAVHLSLPSPARPKKDS